MLIKVVCPNIFIYVHSRKSNVNVKIHYAPTYLFTFINTHIQFSISLVLVNLFPHYHKGKSLSNLLQK